MTSRISRNLAPSGQTLVINEVQRWPDLTLALKLAIDRDRRPGRFVLTGSSAFLESTSTPESLAGRAIMLDLYGFSQAELIRQRT